MASLKEQILNAQDSPLLKVIVEQWNNAEVYIKVMSGTERDAWESETYATGEINRINFRARYLVKCLCDDQGNRLFQDNEAEQLGKKSVIALDHLYDLATKHNKLSKADEDELAKKKILGTPNRLFYLKLAHHRRQNVEDMLATTNSAQLAEWKAFNSISPIDLAERLEIAIAIVAQTVWNKGRNPNQDALKASDFLIDYRKLFEDKNEDKSAENLWTQLESMASQFHSRMTK